MNYFTYKKLELNGRLGNQLWQIASTIGMAHDASGIPLFNSRWEYRKYFRLPEDMFGFIHPAKGVNVHDGGTNYLQECHYWWKYYDEILDYFKPSPEATANMKRKYPVFFEEDRHRTSIHVRRGDYLKYPRHFPLPTARYYNNAMDLIRLENPDTQFIVFSDDIPWCKANFPSDIVFIDGISRPVEVNQRRGEPEDQYDMFLQARCDRHIIANSTFSWWGAVLGKDTRTIYPSVWYGPELSRIPWRRMIPDNQEWIAVEC